MATVVSSSIENRNDLESQYHLSNADGTFHDQSNYRGQIELFKRKDSKAISSKSYSPLVSSCRHLLRPNGSIIGDEVARSILPLFPSFCSAIPADVLSPRNNAALASIDGRKPICHARVRDFVLSEFGPALHKLGFGRKDRIAVVLPNGPELALSIVSIINWASCVPLNAVGARSELEMDLKGCNADLVIGPHAGLIPDDSAYARAAGIKEKHAKYHVAGTTDIDSAEFLAFDYVRETALKLGIPFVGLLPSRTEAGIFELVPPKNILTRNITPQQRRKHLQDEADSAAGGVSSSTQVQLSAGMDAVSHQLPNSHEDEVLVLFTSGTTGSKKLVPHRLGEMLVATATISLSWDLTPSDTNCNLMPLFHVGGIVRQVFSPLMSGGCVICCPSFDPSIFWALMTKKAFTWYYAAPTMHQIILQTGKEIVELNNRNSNLEQQSKPKLRMIANAAGGLLPSLAIELRKTFHANVLPSYGMTECMPISSPPANYELGRPGTSGVAVGPEIAILDLSSGKALPDMTDGPICVRGSPCFRGYGHNHASSEQKPTEANDSFLPGGWFNTGDLGYMDKDGYLYITGRSKEVINRGGEIISPLEVEESVVAHPDVIACAAFSAKHDVLQEAVGIVIVPAKDKPRMDLHSLHDFLGQERLAAAKWPQCIVFMDALPKNNTNKLLRVKLCERLGLPELNDGLYPIERTFEATCPPQGTPVKIAIPAVKVKVHPNEVQAQLKSALTLTPSERVFVTHHPTRIGALVCYCTFIERIKVLETAEKILHKYAIPTHFVQFDTMTMDDLPDPVSSDSISAIKQGLLQPCVVDALTEEIQDLYQDLLDLDCRPHPDENFFNLGGNSMLASQLAAKLRKKHSVPLSGAEVFHHASCNQMASVVRERHHSLIEQELLELGSGSDHSMSGTSSITSRKDLDMQGAHFSRKKKEPRSGNFINFYQILPLTVIFPTWQLTRFFLFFCVLVHFTNKLPWNHRFLSFVVSLVCFHIGWVIMMPLVFVCIKWGVVGRYKAGRYPLWGPTYLRWWFVDVCRNVIGRGIYGSTEFTLSWYYRLLGAKIGKDARISLACDIAEYDLVKIGEGAAIDDGTLRGFALDNGCMLLGPVTVGNYASIGLKSIVAPNTGVPDHCHLGPQASSYETGKSLDVHNGKYNRYNFPDPNPLLSTLICSPLLAFCNAMSHLPAMTLFYLMLTSSFHHDAKFHSVGDVVAWLCVPQRIPYYLGIRVARAVVAPLIYMICAIGVKRVVIGKFEPGPVDLTSQWQLMRHYMAASLFTREALRDVTEIIGRHFELVSIMYRMLGAKVGERVFWPGSQMEFTGEFDLLEIGDDVVFGSRSAIMCRSTESLEMVRLCAGSNIADNCVVMPGVIMGKNSVLGSSGIAPPGWYFPESSVWFGSKYCEPVLLERGIEDIKPDDVGAIFSAQVPEEKLQFYGDDSTLRPFGKAFYNHEANYKVLPLWAMIGISILIISFIAILHAMPILLAVHAVGGILFGFPIAERQYEYGQYPSIVYYILLIFMYIITHNLRVLAWVGIEIGSKWALMKKRTGGRYNWDTSTYNQRWEIYQIITRVRRIARYSFLDFLHGTPYIATFFRALGCTIGENTCLYPTGGDPYMPEPDLVTIGNNCAIDQAALVCHLNTRGNFELNPIEIGDNVTLRNRSRIQMGSKIERGSMLLEHSLAMTGEIIEAESVWQGAPATTVLYYANMEKKTWEPYVPDPFGGANLV